MIGKIVFETINQDPNPDTPPPSVDQFSHHSVTAAVAINGIGGNID
jgi:hypothetical protein